MFRITATAGQRLHFSWHPGAGANANYYLYSPSNQHVTSGSFGNAFDANFPMSGDYFLALRGLSVDTTPYTFTATNTSDTAVSASGFGAQAGSVPASGKTTFTFTAPAGRVVYFNSRGLAYNVSYTITAPDNSYVTSGGVYYNNGPFRLNQSGTYTVTLSTSASSDQTFSYRLLDLGDPALPALTFGSEVKSANLAAQGVDVFAFTGTAGQHLYFDSLLNRSTDSSSASWYVVDSDNLQNVASGNVLNDLGTFTLAESGTYYFLLTNTATTTTTYDFRLLDAAAQKTLKTNATVNDPLDPGSSANLYNFTGQAGVPSRQR